MFVSDVLKKCANLIGHHENTKDGGPEKKEEVFKKGEMNASYDVIDAENRQVPKENKPGNRTSLLKFFDPLNSPSFETRNEESDLLAANANTVLQDLNLENQSLKPILEENIANEGQSFKLIDVTTPKREGLLPFKLVDIETPTLENEQIFENQENISVESEHTYTDFASPEKMEVDDEEYQDPEDKQADSEKLEFTIQAEAEVIVTEETDYEKKDLTFDADIEQIIDNKKEVLIFDADIEQIADYKKEVLTFDPDIENTADYKKDVLTFDVDIEQIVEYEKGDHTFDADIKQIADYEKEVLTFDADIEQIAKELLNSIVDQAVVVAGYLQSTQPNSIIVSKDAMADINEKLEENADLKLQLNASQQVRASLELQLRQKEEIILKSQTEVTRKEMEIKQLKDKLEEKCVENDNTQSTKELQETVKALKARESKLISELNAKKNDELNYRKIMEEYENTLEAKLTELQKLQEEHETVKKHLANLELAFSDVHQKYERCKKIIDGFKCNEDALRQTLMSSEDSVIKSEEKYESLKAHAKTQIEKSNQEMQLMRDQFESEIHKLTAIIRRLEIKNASLADSLDYKTKECSALAALCDEVISMDSPPKSHHRY